MFNNKLYVGYVFRNSGFGIFVRIFVRFSYFLFFESFKMTKKAIGVIPFLSRFINILILDRRIILSISLFSFFSRMNHSQCISLCLMALVLGQAATLPQHTQYPQQFQQQVRDERKFAEKPNAMKKVALDDLDDISTNQIQVNYRYIKFLQYFYNLIYI